MGAAELAREWFERVWQKRDVEAITELMAPGAIGHLRTCDVVGAAGFVQLWQGFLGGIPDMAMDIEDIVAEGDRAVVRWRVRGTHSGDGLGMAPTNQRVDFTGMTMVRVEDGRIVEGWDEWDFGGVMAKLGARSS